MRPARLPGRLQLPIGGGCSGRGASMTAVVERTVHPAACLPFRVPVPSGQDVRRACPSAIERHLRLFNRAGFWHA